MDHQQGLGRFRPKLISIAVASCFVSGAALANPTGHTVVHGSATFKEVGNALRITNSPNAVINWHSFSIGASEITKFIQQSQSSAVLNRVVGSGGAIDPSVILGTLKSNGKVFLINPGGVLFGAGSQVDVGGLVAGSLNLSNADFLANRLKFTDGNGAGSVVNHGTITTPTGGEVFLVGSAVTNGGVITSPSGDVVLAAGNSVELVNPGTPNLRVEITATDNQAVNLGRIVADSGRIGIYAGLINNSGTVRASSAVAEGGRILLKAKQAVTLESTSILDASGAGGGTIEVLAKDGGTVNVAGRLDASAPKNGDGGFIETSAANVNIADGTIVTTVANRGTTGLWLIDPVDDFRIGPDGNVSGQTVSENLNSTNQTYNTTAAGGNLYVDDPISWGSPYSLTLLAHNDVYVNQSITNTGNGAVKLYSGWDGGSTSAPVVTCCGSVFLDAPINLNQAAGEAWLVAGGAIYQMGTPGTAPITANTLLAEGRNSGVFLSNADNRVNILAGHTQQGSFQFRNERSLIIGSVGGRSGINADGGEGQVSIEVVGAGNNLTVNQPVNAESSFQPAGVMLSSANGNLLVNADVTATSSYGGGILLQAGGMLAVSNATISANTVGFGSGFESSFIGLQAGGPISVVNSTVSANTVNGGSAVVGMNAGTDLTLTNSQVEAVSSGGEIPGPTLVGLRAGNDVTIGGNVTSEGSFGSPGWLSDFPGVLPPEITAGIPSDATGIAIMAGNRIIGGTGILDATSDQAIRLMAVNGIGAAGATPAPVKILEDTPELFFQNTGTTAGDIAVSFTTGDLIIDGDIVGTKNNNPNGTYFIGVENGNLTLSVPFLPGESSSQPLLAGQSVTMLATGNVTVANNTDGIGSINASGSGNVKIEAGGAVTTQAGTNLAGAGIDIKGASISSSGNWSAGTVTALATGPLNITNGTINGSSAIALQGNAVTLDNTTLSGGAVSATATGGALTLDGGTVHGTAIALQGNTVASTGALTGGPVSATAASGISIDQTPGIILGQLKSNTGTVAVSTGGSITDGVTTGFNIEAPNAVLNAGGAVGTVDNPIETKVGAVDGTASSGFHLINQGNLNILELAVTAGDARVGSTQLLKVVGEVGVSGNLDLAANNGMVIDQAVIVGGNLNLDSGAGDLGIAGTTVSATNINMVSDNNIVIGHPESTLETKVIASNLLKATSARDFSVTGGANDSAHALLQGLDVELRVGTAGPAYALYIDAGNAGASARIHSGSPTSITLDFPKLSSGGFFVNGENTVHDSATNSGFFANNQPAVLGENLVVTYGVAPPPPPPVTEVPEQVEVDQAIDTTIASTNQLAADPSGTNNTTTIPGDDKKIVEGTGEGTTPGPEGNKGKKGLPVCN